MRLVIIGGGAAGFMAAVTAAQTNPEAQITILEKNRTVLNKVRISGGGRCNVTHACYDHRALASQYPRGESLLRKLLPLFDVRSTIFWFESKGVPLKVESDGRMFPESNSSETIITCLLAQAATHHIQVRTSTGVQSFTYSFQEETENTFNLLLQNGETITADRLLIATGGHPQRKGFDWVAEHGHRIETPLPSLFTFNVPQNYLKPLSGVSMQDTALKIMGTPLEWRGPLLITHWGFSGPAVLKLSAWGARELAARNYDFVLRINWLPALTQQEIRQELLAQKGTSPKQMAATQARFGVPHRLWKALLEKADIEPTLRWLDVSNKGINRLVDLLTNSQFNIQGKSTYKEEFVTAGGVSLSEVNPMTLESVRVPGLYFAGEILDVDGITGGFNFQNAWTTGYIAGKMIGTSQDPILTRNSTDDSTTD
ncbi:NAD(P)/FAD-dependent oxidoreductase [Salmonirosea aquatica]|uniref:Aminoacetone oxidase family FAD-binding enzyme n=1 Tax=Salmonirosea aquatica TaxID=2654236 RepID=A0A7C9BG80_9BACT|nr:aminoacetone oxidase family FAD-binding enzyme [Cytophagaceae bacterium SJW1-29]